MRKFIYKVYIDAVTSKFTILKITLLLLKEEISVKCSLLQRFQRPHDLNLTKRTFHYLRGYGVRRCPE